MSHRTCVSGHRAGQSNSEAARECPFPCMTVSCTPACRERSHHLRRSDASPGALRNTDRRSGPFRTRRQKPSPRSRSGLAAFRAAAEAGLSVSDTGRISVTLAEEADPAGPLKHLNAEAAARSERPLVLAPGTGAVVARGGKVRPAPPRITNCRPRPWPVGRRRSRRTPAGRGPQLGTLRGTTST